VNIDENENRTEVIVNADGNSFDIQNKEGKKDIDVEYTD